MFILEMGSCTPRISRELDEDLSMGLSLGGGWFSVQSVAVRTRDGVPGQSRWEELRRGTRMQLRLPKRAATGGE